MTHNDEPPLAPNTPPSPEAQAQQAGQLKGAMKAFRKKLNSMRLDKESRIGGPLSSGKSSGITAITPPAQFPRQVWEELAKQGHLVYEGQGLYRLAKE
jgi:hypothetical protein